MRIPHEVNENTIIVYKPSPQSLNLVGENERTIVADDFEWNQNHCPTLVDFCVQSIALNFEKKPLLNELSCVDRDHLLEVVSTDLPLELIIPLIHDEYYWQRRYRDKFGVILNRKPDIWTWKSLYLERHVQYLLENAEPQYGDEDEMDEILDLCFPFVRRLIVTQLQPWRPPRTMDKEDIPEKYPIDHINFTRIFTKLHDIEEFQLMYGVHDVSKDFTWDMFKISVSDCQKLGKAICELKNLRILRINRSKIEDDQARALMQGLIKNRTLVELDLSHCEIRDQGALCIAKVLGVHPNLQILNLTNNFIKGIGAQGLGFSLLLPTCAPLVELNLRLNPLGHAGAMGIMRALVRGDKPQILSMSGCLFEEVTPIRVAQMLRINTTLRKLDVSNNWFDEAGGEELVTTMKVNKNLHWLDLRDTDITAEQLEKINKALLRNRTGQDEPENEGEEEIITDILATEEDKEHQKEQQSQEKQPEEGGNLEVVEVSSTTQQDE